MSKLNDELMLSNVSSSGKCLLGDAVDVYRNDGRLKKLYQDQLNRLDLQTIKVVAHNSYNVLVYAIKPDYTYTIK